MEALPVLVALVVVLARVESSSVRTVHVRDGSSVTLYCDGSIEQAVWWTSRTVTHSECDRRPIYRHRLMVDIFEESGRFSAWSLNNGTYALRITDVTIFDSGEYQCIPDEGLDIPILIKLIVLLNRTALSEVSRYLSYEHRVGALYGSEVFTFNSTLRVAWIHYSNTDTVKPVLFGKSQVHTVVPDVTTYTLSIPNVLRSSTGYYFGVAYKCSSVNVRGHVYRLSIDHVMYYPGILDYFHSRMEIPADSRTEIRLHSTHDVHLGCCSESGNNVTWYVTKWYADRSVPVEWTDIIYTSGLFTYHSMDNYRVVDTCLYATRINAILDAGTYGCVTPTFRIEYSVVIQRKPTYNEVYDYTLEESIRISCNLTDSIGWMYNSVPIWSARNGLLDSKHLSFADAISAHEITISRAYTHHSGIYTCANDIGHRVDINVIITLPPVQSVSAPLKYSTISPCLVAIILLYTI